MIKFKIAHPIGRRYNKSLRMKRIHNAVHESMIEIDLNHTQLAFILGELNFLKCLQIVRARLAEKHIKLSENEVIRSINFCHKQRQFNEYWNLETLEN